MDNIINKYIKYIVIISVTSFIISCLITSPKLIEDYWSCLGYAISVTTGIATFYVKWGWRWNPLEKTPKFKSEYSGITVSDYNKKERKIKVTIKQNLLSIHISMDSEESHSTSISSSIFIDHNEATLVYGYLNESKACVRDKSPIHYGMTYIRINQGVDKLHGIYFTDRRTIGDIYLESTKKNSLAAD